MRTPNQLRSQLAELGIRRGLRALTDWRAKGLLPPLRPVSGGRAKGIQRVWDHDVLDQAIAVHYALTKHVKADDALLCLWLSGYSIDGRRAKRAWLKHLQRGRRFADRTAAKSKDGYLGVGRILWRAVGKPERLREFVVGVVDALFDDTKVDFEDYRATTAWILNGAPDERRPTLTGDDAYRLVGRVLFDDLLPKRRGAKNGRSNSSAAVREAIERCIELFRVALDAIADDEAAPHDRTYKVVDNSWEKFGTETFLPNRETVRLVRSLTVRELNATRESLTALRAIVGRCVEWTSGSVDRAISVRVQIEVLASMGLYLAPQLVVLGRRQPTWPMAETILAIHDFVMRVQSTDIARKSNKIYQVSPRVISEWTTATQELLRLWAAVAAKNTQDQKTTGQIGQPSGAKRQNPRAGADDANAKPYRSY